MGKKRLLRPNSNLGSFVLGFAGPMYLHQQKQEAKAKATKKKEAKK